MTSRARHFSLPDDQGTFVLETQSFNHSFILKALFGALFAHGEHTEKSGQCDTPFELSQYGSQQPDVAI